MISPDGDGYQERIRQLRSGPPVFVVSGGTGATGELLARNVAAQFSDVNVPIYIETKVHDAEQIRRVVAKASGIPGAIIVHTMVNRACRHLLVVEASRRGVVTFDLTGPLLDHLTIELDMQPLGQPGLYHKLHQAQFARIEAIEFTVAHDDGKRVQDLAKAEIILIGVSRAGKTPLSMYLSMFGWKVANVPFVPQVPMPEELFSCDMRRVVGLMIEPSQLVLHRKSRSQRTGIPEGTYVAREEVIDELRAANHFFYRHSIPVVETTDKPIESCADEIAGLVSRRIAAVQPLE